MTDTLPPTKVFELAEKKTATTFIHNKWYIGSRDGNVSKVRCVRGGSSDDNVEPPVFLLTGSTFAFEFKLFDWLLADPA